MFDKIGKKIKITAMVIAGVTILVGAYIALSLFESDLYRVGAFVFIGSIIMAWLETCSLYGFGEIIDKVTKIAEETKRLNDKSCNADKEISESRIDEQITMVQDEPNMIKTNGQPQVDSLKDEKIDYSNKEKVCPICGVVIDKNRAFCLKCGESIKKQSENISWD